MKTIKTILSLILVGTSCFAFAGNNDEKPSAAAIEFPEMSWGDTIINENQVTIVDVLLADSAEEFTWSEEIAAEPAKEAVAVSAIAFPEFIWGDVAEVRAPVEFPEFNWGDAEEIQSPIEFPEFNWGEPGDGSPELN